MKKGKLYRYLARFLAAVFAVWLFPLGMEAKADPPSPYAEKETPELHSFYYYSGAQDTLSATEPEKWWTKLEKYVRYRQESDTFRLTLRVQGNTVITQTQAAPIVTVLVIDTSVNMGETVDYQSKLEHVRQAAKGYVDTVLSDEAAGYVAVVGYDDYGYMPDGGYFSSDHDRVIDIIDSLEVNSEGYPNTQGGLIGARWVLQALKGVDAEAKDNPATTYNVVFLSEGTPSAYYTGDLSWLTDASIHGDDYESFASDAYAAMEAYEGAHDTYTLGYYEYQQWHPPTTDIWGGTKPGYYSTQTGLETIEKVYWLDEICTQAVKVQSDALKQTLAARGRVFSVGYTDGSGTYLEIGSDAGCSFDADESSLGQVYQAIAQQHVAGETGESASVCDAVVTDEIPDGFTVTDYSAIIVKGDVEAAYIAGDPVFGLDFRGRQDHRDADPARGSFGGRLYRAADRYTGQRGNLQSKRR